MRFQTSSPKIHKKSAGKISCAEFYHDTEIKRAGKEMPVKTYPFFQIKRSHDLTVKAFAVAKSCLELIVPDKVCFYSNSGLTLKISPSFWSILLKKKMCAFIEIFLMLFKIVD